MFSFIKRAQAIGLMGINRRNIDFIFPSNTRRQFALVDNKLTTKEMLEEAGLPVPQTYARIQYRSDIEAALNKIAELDAFVIKPLRSLQGRGITVISRREENLFLTPKGRALTLQEIQTHIESILSGMHSSAGIPDQAFIEQYIIEDKKIASIHGTQAVSDIRLILYQSHPVMAMLRVPCQQSGGVANLHAGGIGIGVDLKTGVTFGGIQHDRPLEKHPDTAIHLSGHTIPGWHDFVERSRAINAVFGMDYLGVDFVIDHKHGPLILEANARPGLAIQLANRKGLLQAIHNIPSESHT